MSERKIVGQLKDTRGASIDIEWEIADFLSLSDAADECYYSSQFSFCNLSWFLKLYPNGKRNTSEGYIELYVFRGDLGSPVSATFSLFLKRTDGREEIVKEIKKTFEKVGPGWGASKAIERSELVERKSEFLPSGVLTVVCSLKCDEAQRVRGIEKLCNDLKGLLVSADESDVTVRVQGEEFRLHRAILAARTPVFNSMFRHDMQEKATGVVSVVDCETGPFRTFVHYLYSSNTDELSIKNVFSLYKIADKYLVHELKAMCLEFIKGNLSVDTFCDTLDFALQHEKQDLIDQAADFLSGNSSDIMGTEDWQNLMRSHTKEINEVLMQAFSRIRETKK